MAEIFYLQLSNGLQYPYEVVISKRAKYIRIKLSQNGALSVTIPISSKMRFAHEFLLSKKTWIEKNLTKIKTLQEKKRPNSLDLTLINEIWSIQYVEIENVQANLLKVIEKENKVLEVKGNPNQLNDNEIVFKTLNKWCKHKAKSVFNSMMQEIAEEYGFHYHRLSIRTQKTRWGSCSHQKNINLNSKLLFMPEEVVRYVMIHELCHTIEMNHSNRFWALVEECDHDYRLHKQRLKTLGNHLVI